MTRAFLSWKLPERLKLGSLREISGPLIVVRNLVRFDRSLVFHVKPALDVEQPKPFHVKRTSAGPSTHQAAGPCPRTPRPPSSGPQAAGPWPRTPGPRFRASMAP